MTDVLTVGELLVEIMRPEADIPFAETGEFVGPFASGAPGIFSDAVARLEADSGIVAAVGDDGFGDCILGRLERDGVDTSQVIVSDNRSTGVAFVGYFTGGSRQFIYHMDNAAAGEISKRDVQADYLQNARALHVNGSSVAMGERMREACYEAVTIARRNDLLLSLDPNLRTELLSVEESREILDPIVDVADVVTPTEDELATLTGASDPTVGASQLLDRGIDLVALKRGADGCRLYTNERRLDFDAFDAREIDPTGAGDAFSAAIIVGLLEGMPDARLGAFANATGAKAVSEQGPMEGLPTRDEVIAMVDATDN
ncbi:sugar kinase [Halorhabdus amylolytica]|uniref:sugar kinase n=1 Tax=Halorhabdus amylolytica TaxID=2559573 RepID=UPI0010AA6404|nr:sugar kinase [Halorhabdus amylolytica]